jgi:glycosyltransferase involved in cell wall biosynthesis
MHPDISVVIATHNQLARLRLVLCGLASQHFPKERFEIIVVDDGCTDGTDAMLAAEYPDVHVVPMQPNVGRCRARNAGVEQARGALVAFLDGDALPHPDWLDCLWTEWERGGRQRYLCGFMYSLPLIEYSARPAAGRLRPRAHPERLGRLPADQSGGGADY